jgi:hypothetical protein
MGQPRIGVPRMGQPRIGAPRIGAPRIGQPRPMQAGLAHVLRELISFDGSEIYGAEWPQLVGRTFDQACFAFR